VRVIIRKYERADGQRIAVRVDGALYFLHSDHLGSATLTTDASGNRVGELHYTPYGITRYEWGSMLTDRRYTGQRWDPGLGLYDYRARYYHPALGRFVQADTVVPEPGNPQSLNRYAYVLNNPIRYNDPTGHAYECGVYAGTSCADVGPKFPGEIIQAPPDALDNVWAVTEFVGAVVLEPADWVLTARDFLSGQGSPWALVGLLPLVPSSVGKYADEAADAIKATNITKASIIADLSTGTTQSRRIAQAMEEGKIGVNILGDEMFEKAYRFRGGTGSAAVVDAFAYGRQIYLRQSSADIFRDAVHEGTHALDYISGFQGTVAQWEKRAYFFERQFQLYKGRSTEFKTLNDILKHIKRAY